MMGVCSGFNTENTVGIELFYLYSTGTMYHALGVDDDTYMRNLSVLMVEEYQVPRLRVL